MIDWSSLHVLRLWPLVLAGLALAAMFGAWRLGRQGTVPDVHLFTHSRGIERALENAVTAVGIAILLLIPVSMCGPTIVRVVIQQQTARDFLLLVDTSRSMRHDTAVRRDAIALHFPRRVGAFARAVDDPAGMPYAGRYEIARESLLGFLQHRGDNDRVGLIFFNDDTHPVTALTTDLAFVESQLAMMDDYVNWGTDIAAAIDSGLSMLSRYRDRNRRALILMTDAETRYTAELEQQLARLARLGVPFYLLWISDDRGAANDKQVAAFIDFARSIGSVAIIDRLDSESLRDALQEIGRLESYRYAEQQRHKIDLAAPLLDVARPLLVAWLVLMATVLRPRLRLNNAG